MVDLVSIKELLMAFSIMTACSIRIHHYMRPVKANLVVSLDMEKQLLAVLPLQKLYRNNIKVRMIWMKRRN